MSTKKKAKAPVAAKPVYKTMAKKKAAQKAEGKAKPAETKKKAPMATEAKVEVAPKAKPSESTKKLSAIDAAARVLGDSKEPMSCQQLIEAMATQNLWTSPGGKTPAATLYSAILREMSKGNASRFVKADRGRFSVRA